MILVHIEPMGKSLFNEPQKQNLPVRALANALKRSGAQARGRGFMLLVKKSMDIEKKIIIV